MSKRTSRRKFIQTSSAIAATASVPYIFTGAKSVADDLKAKSPNDRLQIGCIGTGDRWRALVNQAMNFVDVVAVCDADRNHMEAGRELVMKEQSKKGNSRDVEMYEDFRKLLDRKDIDAVIVATPDHWHSRPSIHAMKAGKDVYCEKPLTLTIDEGKKIRQVLQETNRVFQVGTQQRSEMNNRFITAVALAHSGRLGDIKKITCAIGGAPSSPTLPKTAVPTGLNWDLWLGQAPMVDYVELATADKKGYPHSRTHYEFRWWYEYSGGKMTDWGAHHVDIGMWALNMGNSGPISVEGTATHPVPYKNGYPTLDNQYNTATEFLVTAKFASGAELIIRHDTQNGVTIEGTKGKIFVSREKIEGEAVTQLSEKPLPAEAFSKLLKGKAAGNHMGNWVECVRTRTEPVSDVFSHHRAMTTCHLANIAIRLGRKLNWNPETEQIVGDDEANKWQAREQRKGYEVEA